MKKLSMLMLLFIMLFSMTKNAYAAGVTSDYNLTAIDYTPNCSSAILMDGGSGRVLFSYNSNQTQSPASVTKIMTLLLVMEAIENKELKLDDNIIVSENAAGMGGSQVFLQEGECFTLEELIKCTVIASANDAAVALAEAVCGSVDLFVSKMNERAKKMGLENTMFENPTGLDDETVNHYSSANDIAIMSRELLKYDIITKYSSMWQDSIRDGEFTLTNTNRLVRYYDGCNGLKTGSTDKAGYCISTTAKRGNMQLIAVVMGAKTRDERNKTAKELLDLGFANYAVFCDQGEEIDNIRIKNGTELICKAYSDGFSAPINKKDLSRVTKSYEIPEYIEAPKTENERIGRIVYTVDGIKIGEADLKLRDKVTKIEYFDLIEKLFKYICSANV